MLYDSTYVYKKYQDFSRHFFFKLKNSIISQIFHDSFRFPPNQLNIANVGKYLVVVFIPWQVHLGLVKMATKWNVGELGMELLESFH